MARPLGQSRFTLNANIRPRAFAAEFNERARCPRPHASPTRRREQGPAALLNPTATGHMPGGPRAREQPETVIASITGYRTWQKDDPRAYASRTVAKAQKSSNDQPQK